jgi:hypothetical protein
MYAKKKNITNATVPVASAPRNRLNLASHPPVCGGGWTLNADIA